MSEQDCERCGRPAAPCTEAGRLFIWLPLGHTQQKLRAALEQTAVAVSEVPGQSGLIVAVTSDEQDQLARLLDERLTRAEARDSRALFMAGNEEPGFAQLGQVESLETFIARRRGGWLQSLLHAQRVTTHFQPIFHVAEPDQVFAHECLLRGIDEQGAIVSPGLMFELATRADLVFPLDRLARITAVQNAAAQRISSQIFINFTPAAVYDPINCLQTTVAAVEQAGLQRERIVFEVIETERIGDPDHLANVLGYYRDAGFKVALDDLGGGYAGLGLLPSLRPDFVKLDRSLVDGVGANRVQSVIIERVTQMAHDLGIEVIAEGVEQAEDLDWLQAHKVDYVQGFLLARPAPTPYSSR
ncbi:MAG: EAL domain-containing protein [Lamprobacter sp.]|uniref:EAL domain-containing protein n=1 Tax=Lamprobacter sp. TaxID=3100796 RepID=UPI002B260440|nr:EAL domain-containing protein [Lamprobacter sp.]MEA3641982.1 EAL domain-containing protein [Lamprobacter sp.]